MMLSKNVLYYGKDEPLPEVIALRAGALRLVYENGSLRYIRLGNHEILRRIYCAVRDRNWRTIPLRLFNAQLDIRPNSFDITFDAEHVQDGIDFYWRGTFSGSADGMITCRLDGEARSTFVRNRIGFCVLYPLDYAGTRTRVEHVNGSSEDSIFPVHVAPQFYVDGKIQPHHPYVEMRALSHEIRPDDWAEVRFEGDVFELEDQRNWLDGSYKVYSTPLRLPYPVEVQQGTRIHQAVTVTMRGDIARAAVVPSDTSVTFTVNDSVQAVLPRIGLSVASHDEPLTSIQLARLRALHLSHLRVDLTLGQPDYPVRLRRAVDEGRALGVPLEIALTVSQEAELRALETLLEETKPEVWRWLIYDAKAGTTTSPTLITLVRERMGHYAPMAHFGVGTSAFFAEINRDRPPAHLLDFVCYSANPQVHSADNESMIEACAAIRATAITAAGFADGRPAAITPLTLKSRFNPSVSASNPQPAPGELPALVDERQMSLFGAAWTLGSLKYAAESGSVAYLTLYETTGWYGVMEIEGGSPVPQRFRSIPGGIFPLYHVLADVGDFAGGDVIANTSSQPLIVNGLVLRHQGMTRILLANFTAHPQQVNVRGVSGIWELKMLDETSAEDAMRSPEQYRTHEGQHLDANAGEIHLELLPYALARLDATNSNR